MTEGIRPEDILNDTSDHATFGGTSVRKGSVAAFVANAKLLEQHAPGTPEHAAAEAALRELAPAVRAVGVFDVFAPRAAALRDIVDA